MLLGVWGHLRVLLLLVVLVGNGHKGAHSGEIVRAVRGGGRNGRRRGRLRLVWSLCMVRMDVEVSRLTCYRHCSPIEDGVV